MGTVDHAVKMPCIDMSNVQCVDGGMILNALNKFEYYDRKHFERIVLNFFAIT